VASAVRLSEVRFDSGDVYWSEGRPAEGGRTQLVRRSVDGITTDLLPEGMDARTAVHEYGGAAWWVRDGVVWLMNWVSCWSPARISCPVPDWTQTGPGWPGSAGISRRCRGMTLC
jgi:hypothetical protein